MKFEKHRPFRSPFFRRLYCIVGIFFFLGLRDLNLALAGTKKAIARTPQVKSGGEVSPKVVSRGPQMPKSVQKGVISVDETQIYQSGDFDAPVIAIVYRGQSYDISTETVGPFYMIRLKTGVVGYISDIDIKPMGGSAKTGSKDNSFNNKLATLKKEKPIASARYRGVGVEKITFTENTMGKIHSEDLLFYGLKISGENTLISGPLYMDFNLLFHSGAPIYYKNTTERAGSGWIALGEFLFETTIPESRYHMLYFGFGPLLKVSHFDVSILDSDVLSNYSMDDIVGGIVFNLGLAFKVMQISLRLEGKYYVEKTRYPALGLGVQAVF